MEENIYKGNDIKLIKNDFRKKMSEINGNKELYDFEKKPLIKKLENEYINQLSKINKIEVRFIGQISLTKIRVVELGFLNKQTGEHIDWKVTYNNEKENRDLYHVEYIYSDEKKWDFPTSFTEDERNFPSIRLKSYYTYKPNFQHGEVLIFDVNYVSGQNGKLGRNGLLGYVYFLNFIDEKFIETRKIPNLNCFVVTTTMGDVNHPVVNDFRNYRDEVLLNTILGRLFIKVYYQIGPILSEIIKNNKTLFQISRRLILKLHKRIFKK